MSKPHETRTNDRQIEIMPPAREQTALTPMSSSTNACHESAEAGSERSTTIWYDLFRIEWNRRGRPVRLSSTTTAIWVLIALTATAFPLSAFMFRVGAWPIWFAVPAFILTIVGSFVSLYAVLRLLKRIRRNRSTG